MTFLRRRFSILLMLPFIGAGAANAQDNINLDEVDLSDLMDIKIESASKQVEPLSEAPVPITVITKDMIKQSGVRTIHEALILFVPGYTDAEDRNEMNFAPRGIYATSQQKVLVMVNGHRLNSRSYLTAMPDYGIALHNLDRIEVLRGPGSSLYGNVALSGVVNLITKKGKDQEKSMVELAGGDHGQRRLRFLTGSGDDKHDVLAWGQYYKATGEVHELDGEEDFNLGKTGRILIDGVDQEPAHDFGINYQKGNWTFFGASRNGMWIEPYGSANNPYDYGTYNTFSETGPGLGMSHHHFGARYDGELGGNWKFTFNPYYDDTEINGVLATGGNDGNSINWTDENIGFITQVSRDYTSGFGTGNFIVGAQVDAFEVTDSALLTFTDGLPTAITSTPPLLENGGEEIYSVFVQDKHRLTDKLIFNVGARYDYKNRRRGENNQKLSPRLAVIYLPNQTWEHKLSYSQSFVDAPYWYRYNSFAPFGGSEALNPEVLHAIQAQTVWKSDDKSLRNSAVLYYQKGVDLITNRATAAGTPADPKYINSGRIESWGIENELAWLKSKWNIFWNVQYAMALSATEYSRFEDKFSHVPNIASNLVLNYLFTKEISANLSVKYIGDQVYNCGTFASPAPCDVASATVVNVGGRYENLMNSGVYLDGRVFNVMDTQHFQGGQSGTQIPFRQPGRWFLASLGYEF
jgi:iron complex outermembrane receptor protein